MLISLKWNFLFVHVPKTAGSSLHNLLAPHAQKKNRTLPRRIISHLPLYEDPSKAYFRVHTKALDFQKKISPETFARLHKFAAVRNPYDQMVSYFRFMQRNTGSKQYAEAQNWCFADAVSYFERKNRRKPINQTSWLIGNNGECLVDRIMFFENIANDVSELRSFLGLDTMGDFPHYNATSRGHYRDYYDDKLKRRVERLYEADFDYFGYTFHKSSPTKNRLIKV